MKNTRRDFLQKGAVSLTALTPLMTGGCICHQLNQTSTSQATCCFTPELEPDSLAIHENHLVIDLVKASSLKPIGAAAYIVKAERSLQLIVLHVEKDDYRVLSRLCTHGNQVISYNHKRGLLQCNNFNHSNFDLNGDVVKGPAETPLISYSTDLNNQFLEIYL